MNIADLSFLDDASVEDVVGASGVVMIDPAQAKLYRKAVVSRASTLGFTREGYRRFLEVRELENLSRYVRFAPDLPTVVLGKQS